MSKQEKSSGKSTGKVAKSAIGKGVAPMKSTSSKKSIKSTKSNSGGKSVQLKTYKSLKKSIKMPNPHSIGKSQSADGKAVSGEVTGKETPIVPVKSSFGEGSSVKAKAKSRIEKTSSTSGDTAPSKSSELTGKNSSMGGKSSGRQSAESTKTKTKTMAPKNAILDHGSVFGTNVQTDDSALTLLMHGVHEDENESMKRDETEIFVPGKGDLRSTQPDQKQQN